MLDVLFVTGAEELALNREVNGVMLLATNLLHAGFEAQILHFAQFEHNEKDYPLFIRDITAHIIERAPKCVSFYTLWPTYHIMVRIAMELKKHDPNIHIVFGGPQATGTAQETIKAFDCIDFVCCGEGENTVVPFFTTLLKEETPAFSSIPGLVYRSNGELTCNDFHVPLCDLNTLPRWDERLYLPHHFTDDADMQSDLYFMPIDAGRGCPYNCTFCRTSLFHYRTYRLKSPERIVEDILYFNKKFGIKSFWFTHDAFTSNQKLVAQVCDHIIATGLDIKWRCTARIDCINEELIDKMIQAGMTQIELGVETGSPRMQKLVKKNLNVKNVPETVSLLLNKKLRVALFFMYGFPEETEQDLNETLELLFTQLDAGIAHASMSFCRFFPMTDLTKQYFDDLVYDPEVKILTHNYFGFNEEKQMILGNKAVFPHFYHLDTPIRNEYTYLHYLFRIYTRFGKSIRYLRHYYKGDNLAFYKDFYQSNAHLFANEYSKLSEYIEKTPLVLMDNWINRMNIPNGAQLKALFKFEYDVQKVHSSVNDVTLTETYDFNIFDYRMKLPVEKYITGKTTIRLSKVNGATDMQVLSVQ